MTVWRDLELVPGPFTILLKLQYDEIGHFEWLIFTIFDFPIFTFSKKWKIGILT